MSGWTAMTVHPPKGLSPSADEQAKEAIEDSLEDLYGEDAGGYADRTVQLPRGEVRHTEGDYTSTAWAEEVFNNIPEAKWVVIISANDTSNSGAGEVYKIDANSDGPCDIFHYDKFVGYEGARGNDVTGYIREEHGLQCYSSFEA